MVGISAVVKGRLDLRTELPRQFEYYSLAHLYGGGGVHWSAEGGLCTVRPGDAVLSLPGQQHIYGPRTGEEWREDWLAFTGPRAADLAAGGLLQSGLLKNLFSSRRIREIACLARDQSYEGLLRAAAMLEILLVDIHLSCRRRYANPAQSRLQVLAGEIEAMPEGDWSLPALARRLRLSQSHLRRLFMQAYSMPPHTYIEQVRLRRGTELLRETSLTIAEIAQRVGYSDPFHFSTRFRRLFGISPRGYRRVVLLPGASGLLTPAPAMAYKRG